MVAESVGQRIRELLANTFDAEDWTARQIAAEVGCNLRTAKEHPEYRALLARRAGLPMTRQEYEALLALDRLGEAEPDRMILGREIAIALGLHERFVFKRLAVLRYFGWTETQSGEREYAGHRLTALGRDMMERTRLALVQT